VLAVFHDVALVLANAEAVPAPYAFSGNERYLGPFFPRFRIVAPGTAQGTSLKKYRSTDTWSVMDGEFLDVEYYACRLFCHKNIILRRLFSRNQIFLSLVIVNSSANFVGKRQRRSRLICELPALA
jgi:hypothetical protein